jgi:hypothetical protein
MTLEAAISSGSDMSDFLNAEARSIIGGIVKSVVYREFSGVVPMPAVFAGRLSRVADQIDGSR